MVVPLLALAPPAPLGSSVAHDVTIVTTRKLAQARAMGVPPEEFGIERGARRVGMEVDIVLALFILD
jgi:hypothetical protein